MELNSTSLSLDIKIIGAGISGLATALAISKQQPGQHRITIYEHGASLSEAGAGIQLFSNASRIIRHLGLQPEFEKVVNQPSLMDFRRYQDDSPIGEIPQNPKNEWEYGSPSWQIYRPDLQRILAEACESQADGRIRIVFSSRSKSVDAETGTITFEDNTTVTADLIIAADGLRGRMRNCIPANANIRAEPFPEVTFRTTIPKEKMLRDPSTAELMRAGGLNMVWCGPGSAVLGYPVAAGSLYNLLISVPHHPDAAAVGNWNTPADPAEGAEILQPYCERVRKVWGLVDDVVKWQLGHLPPLPTFKSDNGKLIVVGDAAHAILPHSGQGGAMALEDAVTIAACVAATPDRSFLPRTMAIFNSLRQSRLKFIRRYAASNQSSLNLPDGPEQQKRDELFRAMTAGWKRELAELGEEGVKNKTRVEPDFESPNMGSPGTRMAVFGFDAVDAASTALRAQGLL